MSPLTPLLAALLLWITHPMGWSPPGPPPTLRVVPEEEVLATASPDVPRDLRGSAVLLRRVSQPGHDTIVLPDRAAGLSDETLPVLVHELTHALQARQGRLPDPADRSPAACEARDELEREAWAVDTLWRQAAGRPPAELPIGDRLARLACQGHEPRGPPPTPNAASEAARRAAGSAPTSGARLSPWTPVDPRSRGAAGSAPALLSR